VKYRNDQIREALAAEYALGTLQGAARQRFERSLRQDPALRRLVAQWQARLAPLDEAAQPVTPPARVWRAIQQRVAPASRRAGFWNSIGFWRGTALASTTAAVLLAVSLLTIVPRHETMVVVMSDDQSRPQITVSWQSRQRGEKQLRVRVMGHQTMDPETAWELWMLPPGDQKPVSLGLITTHATQTVVVPVQLQQAIDSARALAMSVEPKGGSPTGLPTGPVLYQGPCTKL
jgi:anti-sigma-K factor RskA